MKRLTYRDKEGRAQWMPELIEDDTGMAGAIIRGTLADYEDADAVKVRHGKWIDPENDDRYTAWHCSRCDYPVKTLGGRPDCRCCPTCGAQMDKEDKHG